jgi:predicted acyl esterase
MLCFASRPPDPLLAGDSWKSSWLQRLESQPLPLEHWLSHQRRDHYWQHGSICEDYSAIQIPSLVICGWCDGYINAPPAMAQHSQALSKAINGPWIHKYPHIALPHPRMDFLNEAIAWWDQWLKGIERNTENLPAYRAFISEDIRPGNFRAEESGRWVAEQQWPSPDIQQHTLYPNNSGRLQTEPAQNETATLCSPQDCGTASGEFFSVKADAELSGDQRLDDAGSLVYDTGKLDAALEILGRPSIKVQVAIDKLVGNLIVRLNDVRPDGSSHRVSWGVLNLCHRMSNENPTAMRPGESETVTIVLDECGYRFLPGHRLRIAISTAYWPMISPPPEAVTATITLGQNTELSIPVRQGGDRFDVAAPDDPNPLADYRCISEPAHRRTVERDLQQNLTHYRVFDDTGEYETPGHCMRSRHTHEECFTISPTDPLSYHATSIYTCYMSRSDWDIRTVCESELRCDKEHYYLNAVVTAWEGAQQVNQRHWTRTIKRDFT